MTNAGGIIMHDLIRAVERMQEPETKARMRIIGQLGTAMAEHLRADLTRFGVEVQRNLSEMRLP